MTTTLQRFPTEIADLELKAVNTPYSREDALQAYELWCKTRRQVYQQEAWRRALPIVNVVLTKEFPTIRDEDRGSFISLGAHKVWQIIAARTAPVTPQYHAFLRTCVRRVVLDEISALIRQREIPDEADPPRNSRQRSVADVDIKIFLEELPEAIRSRVTDEIRFRGAERTACLYILDRYLAGEPPALEILREDCGIVDTGWLCEYVLIRMRIAMYDLRGVKYETRHKDELWVEPSTSSE